jgi:hypothetical protein
VRTSWTRTSSVYIAYARSHAKYLPRRKRLRYLKLARVRLRKFDLDRAIYQAVVEIAEEAGHTVEKGGWAIT